MAETINTVHVTLDSALAPGARDYDIAIGPDILASAEKWFAGRRVLTICDKGAQKFLPDYLKKTVLFLPEGEGTKTWKVLEKTVNWILDQKPDRHTMIAAFGGGVTGDHAGFAAAITLRGLDYVHIPTTLLAQVDSSVGGKTGINTRQGKNLVGAFYQPKLVLADTSVLASLSERHMRAGYAEIVKYAFIGDPQFFEWLDQNGTRVLARDNEALCEAIATSCRAKAAIVNQDEREGGARALLNFGHTFAHALEAACKFDRRLLHGEAVAIGMALAFETSKRMGLTHDADIAIGHMKKLGLPTRIADIAKFPKTSADALIELMASDKKVKGGRLTFILSNGIGKAFATQNVDMTCVKDALSSSMER